MLTKFILFKKTNLITQLTGSHTTHVQSTDFCVQSYNISSYHYLWIGLQPSCKDFHSVVGRVVFHQNILATS